MTNTRIDRLIDVLGRIEQLLQSQTRPAGIESHYTPPQINYVAMMNLDD